MLLLLDLIYIQLPCLIILLSSCYFSKDLDMCVKSSVATCPGSIATEAQLALRFLAAADAATLSPSENQSALCVCQPASAVNCIMEVHHLSKLPTPDWQGLCP